MTKEKINSLGVCMLIFALTKATFLGIGFNYVFKNLETSSLISVIIGVILGYIIITIYLKVMSVEEDLNFTQKVKKTFSKPIAFFINSVTILVSLTGSVLAFWRIVDFLTSQYLTKTPTIIIGILLISLIFYTLSKNIEVLTRFATIIFAICTVMIIINIFGLLPYVDIENLKPINIIENMDNIFTSSIVFAFLFAGPCFFLTIIPKNSIVDKQKLNKMLYKFYTFSGVVLFIIFFLILACLGIEIINIYKYPAYIVLKKIVVLDFVESIENVTFILWYLYLHILCLTALHFTKDTLISMFNIKRTTKSVTIIALILSTITLLVSYFLFDKNYTLAIYVSETFPLILDIILVSVSIIYLIFYKIKRN